MFRCESLIEYEYGQSQCKNLYDHECGADCTSCQWSWPLGDEAKWGSEDAKCRCPAEAYKETKWGGTCNSLDDGQCGTYCKECRWSWFVEDENKWEGDSADCRCKNW